MTIASPRAGSSFRVCAKPLAPGVEDGATADEARVDEVPESMSADHTRNSRGGIGKVRHPRGLRVEVTIARSRISERARNYWGSG